MHHAGHSGACLGCLLPLASSAVNGAPDDAALRYTSRHEFDLRSGTNDMTRVTVVIVNYNGGETLLRCLSALVQQTSRPDIIVVDNASADDSLAQIARQHPAVQVVPLRRNSGFARGFNIGASRIDADDGIVVALNPDTLPSADFIERLTAPFANQPKVGSVAGTLTFSSNPKVIASAGIVVHRNGVALDARVGEALGSLPAVESQPVFGPSGGAAAYRLRVFREVGGFCEPFFLYLEDVDLAWRMRFAGHESVWVPAAKARHDYSASAGEGSALKRRLIARNRIWTLVRCLPVEIWRRDRAAILTTDALASTYGLATLDPALWGRLAALPLLAPRLRERCVIQGQARVSWEAIDQWLQPPVSPRRLRELRQLTGNLANQSTHDKR